jgi:quinol monooxygenase YgiN
MSEPIVFISHFRVKEGKLDAYRELQRDTAKLLLAEKPRTLVYLAYLTKSGDQITIVHAFADAESMDLHVQGAFERAKVGFELFDADGWEIYGRPSEEIVNRMREMAASFGVTLTLQPDFVAGFLRLTSG